MVQAVWSRVFGLAAIGLMLTITLAAQAGDQGAIEQKIFAQFKPTTIAADRSDIVTAGDRVVIQKPGLTMYGVTSPMPPLYTYKNGKIGRGLSGFGKDVQISMVTPGGTAADYPHHPFAPGEKCWVTQVEVQKDGVLFQLYSDAYEEIHYYANLKILFPNKKKIPPVDTVMQLVAEVLSVAPAEKHVDKPVAEAPVCPVPGAAAESKQAKVSGKFNFDEGDTQLFFVSGSVCIMLGPGTTQSSGKYKVSGDTLTMDCTVTGSSFNLKIRGDNLVAENGHVWLRQKDDSPANASPPEIAIGQSKDDVIAVLGKPVSVIRTGVKETFYYANRKVTFTKGKMSEVE